MRALMILWLFGLFGTATVAGCASTPAPVPVVPQSTLAAVVEVSPTSNEASEPEPAPAPERVKHHVIIAVDHLPAAKSFAKGATTYVFWVRASDEEAWANAAHLEQTSGATEAKFEFAEDTLYVHVTAEATADARVPSDKVLLSTRVSRNGACASGVDQNDVTMKVRMCN